MWSVHQLKSSVVKYIDVLAEWNIASHYITFSWLAFKWLARAWRLCQTQVNTHTRVSRKNAPRLPVVLLLFKVKVFRRCCMFFKSAAEKASYPRSMSLKATEREREEFRGQRSQKQENEHYICLCPLNTNKNSLWELTRGIKVRFLINCGGMRIFFKAIVFTLWI